jgi:hypothetical protein
MASTATKSRTAGGSKTKVVDFATELGGFKGGVNIRDAINQLAPDELSKAENLIIEERGGASKRPGCLLKSTVGTSGARILSMFVYNRGDQMPQLLIHTSDGELLYSSNPNAATPTWTSIVTGLSTTAPFCFETFNSKVYMSNGVDVYASWDGTTRTPFVSAPKGKYLRLYKDTMWVSGVPTLFDRVYSSAPGDAENFPVANWVDIAKGDGDLVTGLGSDGIFLIVFKRNRHMHIYDPTTFANRVVDFEKGCESHFSIIQYESNTYFLSRHGFCQYLGDSPSRYLSYKLDPMFDPTIINLNALDKVTAYIHNTRIGWAIPEAGFSYPTIQVEYYPRLSRSSESGSDQIGPFMFQRMPARAFGLWRFGVTETLFAAHNTANKVLKAFSPGEGLDDGQMFQAFGETGAFNLDSSDRVKYIRRMRFIGRGRFSVQVKRNFQDGVYRTYTLDLGALKDYWNAAEKWGEGFWGPDPTLKQSKIDTDMYGRWYVFKFVDAETTTTTRTVGVGSKDYDLAIGAWSILGLMLEGVTLGVRE